MKTRLTVLKLLVVFCVAFATTAGFGQTTYVWTNNFPLQLGGGGDLAIATNWNPNGIPVGTSGPDVDGLRGDILIWDGTTTSDLKITQTGNGAGAGQAGGFGGPTGVRVYLTGSQTHPVTIYYPSAGNSGGWRYQNTLIDSGAGAYTLGTNNPSGQLTVTFGGAAGQFHGWTNNSASPLTINPDLKLQNGGGGAHIHYFNGTGDFRINHTMITENAGPNVIQKDGPGTMIWNYIKSPIAAQNSFLQGPLTISGGLLIMTNSTATSSLFPTFIRSVQNDATLRWDDGAANTDNFGGAIAGGGLLDIKSGTLILSGQNTFTGNMQLNGGALIANSGENVGVSGPLGVGGVISFNGGTLGYGNNNFDYSSRFNDVTAGQQYKIDTGGQFVTFSNNLASSGATLTKLGDGTLTLAGANTYSGLTIVTNTGTLALLGPKTGSGNITVADGATLDVFNNGTQVTPATLTLGSSLGANLEFDNISSTSTAPLAPGTVSSTTTTIININSGTFHLGQSYPLITWTSGSAPAVSLGIVDGASGTLSTNGNTIKFNVVTVALVWNGLTNNSWNVITSTNWTEDGNPIGYANPKQAVLNDTATGATDVTLAGAINPEALTINNSALNYSLASSAGNSLGGNIRFGKRGSGTLTLTGGANTNTGVTTLRGGTTIVSTLANGGSPSDIGSASSAAANLVFNGGILQYTGSVASVDRLFTVRSGGGVIDNEGTGPLTLNNPGAINHGGKLTLDGNTADTNTLASALIGGGSLVKNGTGTWVLTGTNAYGGVTAINAGVLQVGAGGAVGALGSGPVGNNGAIDFNRTGSLTVGGVISGNGSVTKNGSGTVILANNNNYTGGTTINAGTLQIGNGGSAELYINGPIVNNGTLTFTASGIHTLDGTGIISGTGNVIVNGSGRIKAIGANTYTGNTTIDGGTTLLPATFQPCQGNSGQLLSPLVTVNNNGRLLLVRQDTPGFIYGGKITGNGLVMVGANNDNAGLVTLLGTNDYSGGTLIGDQTLILGDGSTPVSGQIVGNVTFTNNFDTPNDNLRAINFNRPDDYIFSGNITTNFATPQVNQGVVQKNGDGTLTLTGNNTYGSGTVINAGTVVVGVGTNANGSLGFGPVTHNGTALIFNRTGNLAVGTVTGSGALVKRGTGTVTLTGASSVGSVTLEAGTLGAAASGSVGSLTVAGNLAIASGSTLLAGLDRSLSPSNSVFSAGSITHTTGGILRLINGGPALVVGDKFTIFNLPVPGGAGMTIVSPGFSVQNDLAVDGSVTVTGVLPPPTITATVSGGTTLNLSWPSTWTGGVLVQVQTNSLAVGLGNNWFTVPGTDAGNTYSAPIVKTNATVFFRLINP